MKGDPLPEDHHIARYCKPFTVGENGLPTVSAFRLRADEGFLSVNWLEYFREKDFKTSIEEVRSAVSRSLTLKPNGRIAVLNVAAVKSTVRESTGHSLRIIHMPSDADESHSGILGYGPDDFSVAAELKLLLNSGDVYPARM